MPERYHLVQLGDEVAEPLGIDTFLNSNGKAAYIVAIVTVEKHDEPLSLANCPVNDVFGRFCVLMSRGNPLPGYVPGKRHEVCRHRNWQNLRVAFGVAVSELPDMGWLSPKRGIVRNGDARRRAAYFPPVRSRFRRRRAARPPKKIPAAASAQMMMWTASSPDVVMAAPLRRKFRIRRLPCRTGYGRAGR